ncbi:MAG: class I SAM-dependent methyltransferase, partial [Gammaproteobacteria bacterium]|nr:class I SAM-dependent methyltransferase [Gammaproteobacteria bacterium]
MRPTRRTEDTLDLTTTLTSYYDAVPYHSHPFPQSAPEHLEALAFLFGLDAPAPHNARVLELGCASGGNLIPFAARHPQARVMGVDLSSVQIRQGASAIGHAGLDNADLRAVDLATLDKSFGEFDYIICHGVYSWVPEAVQNAILRICRENLAPDGVAYISYNTYPGWKAREVVRDAMILRGAPRDEPDEKLSYARGMLEFLEQSARPDSVLKKILDENLPMMRTASSAYLLHEFLEPCNSPCYFKDFAGRAGTQGLSYLADAEPSTMFVQNYGDRVRDPLLRECGGSQILMEQYLDFLVNRTFRQTLLVQQERAGDIRYRLDVGRLRSLQFAGAFTPEDGGALTLDAPEQLCNAIRNLKVMLRLPVHKAVAQIFDERYPATIAPEALIAEVSARIGEAPNAVDQPVMAMLEELLILGAVRIRRTPPPVASQVSDQPLALAAVRKTPALGLAGGASAMVCNQWHEPVEVSLLERFLLPLLDGRRSHEQLAQFLVAEAHAKR